MSPDTISTITDAVLDEVMIWQNRQLDEFYPVIFLDALRVKIRDGHRVVNKAADERAAHAAWLKEQFIGSG